MLLWGRYVDMLIKVALNNHVYAQSVIEIAEATQK